MRCESSSWNVTDTLRTVTTITSNWKGMSRMIWFTSSITRWMRIDGTEYWKEFFLFLFPSSGIPENFLLKEWEKENIPFAQSHNTVRDARLKHSWNPMMKMSVFGFVLEHAFEYAWNILKRHLCHVLYFVQPLFFNLEKMVHFSFYVVSHTQNLGYFSWSRCEVRMWV